MRKEKRSQPGSPLLHTCSFQHKGHLNSVKAERAGSLLLPFLSPHLKKSWDITLFINQNKVSQLKEVAALARVVFPA